MLSNPYLSHGTLHEPEIPLAAITNSLNSRNATLVGGGAVQKKNPNPGVAYLHFGNRIELQVA